MDNEAEALAKRVVALGVGECDHSGRAIKGGDFYNIDDPEVGGFCAELFVQLWEVAGALLTMMYDAFASIDDVIQTFEGDPHAIILACVEALEAA